MSDGLAEWNGAGGSNPEYSPYGCPSDNFLELDNPKDTTQIRTEMESRFVKICDNIKAQGIEIYTIGYAMSEIRTHIYEQCASSPQDFYYSPASSQISTVFQNIAKKVLEKETRIIN